MDPKTYADRFGYYHHSPSAVEKPLEIDIFQKALKRRGETLYFGSPVAVGRGVEDYVSAMLIDGQSEGEAARHAMAALDAHELVPWDSEAEQQRLDILVNNAGNNIPEHFTKVKTKNMEYLVKINTIATFNLAQLCALKMIKSKNRKKVGGAIINMSSQMGHVGGPIRSVYNMTKFGLEGLTKGMSIDLARYNIRVNTVCPTFVVTPMTKKFLKSKKFKREVLENIPLGKFAELSDVASAAVFLASDAASMITGTSLLVDGGWTAK